LVRWLQGEVYGRVKRRVYQKKADQRELMKVIQRNFRKYQTLRNWGWFILIQKTKPLIGQVNIEEELRLLEEQANNAYGAYKEQLDTKERLLQENEQIKEEKKALVAQLESEQGNLGEVNMSRKCSLLDFVIFKRLKLNLKNGRGINE
jgi:myosin heavy subunit